MKVLLVYPPTAQAITSILPKGVEAQRGAFPPLGILYLAGELEKYNSLKIFAIDAPNQKLNYDEIAQFVEREEIEIVGITVLSFHLVDAVELAQKIKIHSPKTKIIAGGPHPHIYPKETLSLGVFDAVVLGEGEKSFAELIKNINEKKPINIKGVLAQGEQITNEKFPDFIKNLDELAFPARRLLPKEIYYSVLSAQKPITTAISSRGCPYKCIFCDRPHLGKKFRARSAENVVSEMEECARMGIKEIVFYDDNFTTQRERVLQIAELVKKEKIKISWDIRARVGDLKKEDYKLLKEAGLVRIHFGVESGDERLLELIRKQITIDQARSAFKWAKEAGIETLAYFMLGLPSETTETINRTIELAKELEADFVHFSLLMLFPATPIYKMALEKGIIERDLWQEFAQHPTTDFSPPIWEENLDKTQLISALSKAYKKFYFRPRYIFSRLRKVSRFSALTHQAKMAVEILKLK